MTIRVPSHTAQAACVGLNPDIFFPPNGAKPHPDAVTACGVCPVRAECLTWSIGPPFLDGYWGGMSENQRRGERRRRHSQVRTVRRRTQRAAAKAGT